MKKPSKPPIFKVGDLVTYKYTKNCPGNKYNYGGACHGGWVGEVVSIYEFNSNANCYKIVVTSRLPHNYTMLESEFLEYDGAISTKEPNLTLYKKGDRIKFDLGDKVLEYTVEDNFLNNVSGYNDDIFLLLGLDKYPLCTEHYGYTGGGGCFPISKHKDYAALTRVINALQEECRKYREQKHSTTKDTSSENPLVVGKWYIKYDPGFTTGYIIICYQGEDAYHYGINGAGNWSRTISYKTGLFIPIDDDNLIYELSKIAVKKGLVVGKHIKMLKACPGKKSDYALSSSFLYKNRNNTFSMGGYTVLDEYGNWAEVWEEEKGVEEKEKSPSIDDLHKELKVIAYRDYPVSDSYEKDASFYIQGTDYGETKSVETTDDYISITGSSIQVKKLRKRRR